MPLRARVVPGRVIAEVTVAAAEEKAVAVATDVRAAVVAATDAAEPVADPEETDNNQEAKRIKSSNDVTAEKNEIQKNAKGPRERHGYTWTYHRIRIFCFESFGRWMEHSAPVRGSSYRGNARYETRRPGVDPHFS